MGEIINTNTAIETQPGGDTGALLDITQPLGGCKDCPF